MQMGELAAPAPLLTVVLRSYDLTAQLKGRSKPMTITRGIVVAAMLAGLAVGTASTAWSDTTMSGHYTWTSTNRNGQSTSGDYYFTPCGDGCASVSSTSGGPAVGQARLVDGQWTLDGTWAVSCPDGTSAGEPVAYHDTWDPNTLAGTDTLTSSASGCGNRAGGQQINTLQLSQAGG